MSLLDVLAQVSGGDTARQVSRQLGTDEGTAQKAITAAVPMLINALSRNAGSADGAGALFKALSRDHDGSILNNVGNHVGSGNTSLGDGILRHVLGGKRQSAEAGLSRMSGLDSGSTAKLLAMLAPLVMGALGSQQRRKGLDQGGLSDLLRQQTQHFDQQAPGSMGVFGKLLDADGDGNVMDDVAKMGAGLLGSLMRGR